MNTLLGQIRRVNATKSFQHFGHFAGDVFYCFSELYLFFENYFDFRLHLDLELCIDPLF